MKVDVLDRLSRAGSKPIRIGILAIDPNVSIFAMETDGQFRVQVYGAVNAPTLSNGDQKMVRRLLSSMKEVRKEIRMMPAKPLTPDVSPGRVLCDLLEIPDAKLRDRRQEIDFDREEVSPKRTEQESPRSIKIQFVGHSLAPSWLHAFGADYCTNLLAPSNGRPSPVRIRGSNVAGFVGPGNEQFAGVVVEYIECKDFHCAIRVEAFDTKEFVGDGDLEELVKAYLGVDGFDVTPADSTAGKKSKKQRLEAENVRGICQVIANLALVRRFEEEHAEICTGLGFSSSKPPAMHKTPGLRLSTLFLNFVAITTALESKLLSGPDSKPSQQKLRDLFAEGSPGGLGEGGRSVFGAQTGETHGALAYSRSPTAFFHEGDGKFLDVDLASAYPTVIGDINVYAGRPVIFEPGNAPFSVTEAKEFVDMNAVGNDGWMMKVSGDIKGFPNTLIPSTPDALNYKTFRLGKSQSLKKHKRHRLEKRGVQHEKWRHGNGDGRDRQYSTLYTDEINSGIVVWATWLMINALPQSQRDQYLALRVESIIYYPREFVARDGPDYDRLVEKHRTGEAFDFYSTIDMETRKLTKVTSFDDQYVSLRCPIKEFASHFVAMRDEAKKLGDQARGKSLSLKVAANALYGSLASPSLPTGNVVAANVVTGTVRALAFAMHMSLNGYQVLTDGVTFRSDQIPEMTFEYLLSTHPDYPVRRPETNFYAIASKTVPTDPVKFRRWYIRHVMGFFGVTGEEYQALFSMHQLEFKSAPGGEGVAFDGLLVDGGTNHAKLVQKDGVLTVASFKARGFDESAKGELAEQLLEIYRSDDYSQPIGPVSSHSRLSASDALAKARSALTASSTAVRFPLGMRVERVQSSKVIKPSQFLFRTEVQKTRIQKELKKFTEATGIGLELLAMRRKNGGSLVAVAEQLYAAIRGKKNRLDGLNLCRFIRESEESYASNLYEIGLRRDEQVHRLRKELIVDEDHPAPTTGLIIRKEDVELIAIG